MNPPDPIVQALLAPLVHVVDTPSTRELLAMQADPLSPAEWKILPLLLAGMENNAIAYELTLGIKTIKTHLSHIMRKLGVRSRGEVVYLLLLLGVLRLDPELSDAALVAFRKRTPRPWDWRSPGEK